MITSDQEEIQDILFLNEEVVEVRHSTKTKFLKILNTSNVVIAAFTTASARLKLYEALKVVNERVLYMDTDSVVYIARAGEPDPKEGCALGDLENEFKCDDKYITEFIAGGAKNYAYKTNKGLTEMKVHGFTLNKAATETLNFDTMKAMIHTNDRHQSIRVEMGTTIKRDSKAKKMYTVPFKKEYQTVFDKRVPSERKSVPFGYVSSD